MQGLEPTGKGTTTGATMKEAKRPRPIDLLQDPGSIGRHRGLHPGVNNEGIVHGRDPVVSLIPGQGLVSGSALRDATGRGRPTQNRNVCHFSFPDRWKPYLVRRLSRPLPRQVLTPDLVAAAIAVMPHRPSTSAGPGSLRSASSRSLPEKRQSKDDMLLPRDGRLGYGRPNQGTHPYMMGFRNGNLPTPEASPDQAATASMTSFLAPATMTMTGHESFMTSMEVPIGMALGSPSHISEIQPSSWQPPQSVTPPRRTPSPPPPPPAAAPQMVPQTAPPAPPPLQRRKTTRQKIFGALFGRGKQSDTAKAADLISANSSAVSLSTTASGREAAGSAVPSRSNTVSGRKGPKHKPILVRSNTDLPTINGPVEPREWEQPPPPPPMPMALASSWNDQSRSVTPSSLASAPSLLDVEIPSIKMERYSVMFSGVLNPEQQRQQRRNSKMTLLERRQATLEKLKSINDRVTAQCEEEAKQLRRASSPQPTQSPGFSMFPPTPGRQQLEVPPTPRSRSNSSPAVMPSPIADRFSDYMQPLEAPPVRKEKKRVTIISPRTEEQNRVNMQMLLEEQQRQQRQTSDENRPQQEYQPEYLPGDEDISVVSRRPEAREEQQQHQPEPEQAFPPRKDSRFAPGTSFLSLDTPMSPPEQYLDVSDNRQTNEPEIVSPFLLKPTVYQPLEPRLVVPGPPTRSPPSPPQPSMAEATSPPILSPENPTLPTTCSPSLPTPVHKGHTLSPSVDLAAAAEEEAEEADPIIKAAVEISVARTVSISRRAGARQKRVESNAAPPQQRSPSQPPSTESRSERPPPIPLARSASVSAGSLQRSRSVKANQITITRAGTLKVRGPGAAPKLVTTTTDVGRVSETKQATPTLVVPPPAELLINSPCSALSTPGAVTPGTAGSELSKEVLARYRKSERVEIVTGLVSPTSSSESGLSDSGRENENERRRERETQEDGFRGRQQFKRPAGFAERRYLRA
ncbi:hypothetical protein B0T20DRAFT_201171 [Sordaria brevicollis]|uniref:Uncharacterized protein n=1 Tax=Sordaria brevicollis TaxID=83679 RepID=A0AAE0PDU2_SORBR|nr:hypothetical protein B0T20DRAFT_201171 [Sordaria brevicollis]